jgi:hypothetical protein
VTLSLVMATALFFRVSRWKSKVLDKRNEIV